MTGYEHLCVNYMSETDGKDKCPKCGFSQAEPQAKEALPYRTVLQDRYMVGRLKRQNGEGKFYIGFDMQQLCTVQIHEFFPMPICARVPSSNDIAVIAGNESLFDQYLKDFINYQETLKRFQTQTGIVPVLDVFEENFTAYSISPWEEAITLRYFVERSGGELTWNASWKLFRPVVSALSTLHASGVGHLGISPDTLFITPEGEMRLGDFCISASRMTDTGLQCSIVPGCAAIEQYDASLEVGEATDVYGLAATLFFALTGVLPKDARERREDPRLLLPASKLKAIPPYVVTALANALQVGQEARTPTFERLRAEMNSTPTAKVSLEETQSLRKIASPYAGKSRGTAPEEDRPRRPKKQTYLWVLLICVIAAIAVVLIAWAIRLFGPGTPTTPTSTSSGNALFVSSDAPSSTVSAGAFGDETSSRDSLSSSSDENEESSEASSQEEEESSSSSRETSSQEDSNIIEAPNLIGMQLSDVMNASSYQISENNNREFNDSIPQGEIIEQTPKPGEPMERGSVITVTVSLGAAMRALPDVAGDTLQQARQAIEDAGFLMQTDSVPSEEPSGTVIGYRDNEAGAMMAYGSEVTVEVSSGQGAN